MEKIIKLNSKYGENNYLKLMPKADGSESKTYVLKTSSPYLRVGKDGDGKNFVDPSGGPLICEGELLEGYEYRVKYVDFTTGFGYSITFE